MNQSIKTIFILLEVQIFTDAGIGMKQSSNIELNKLVNGTDSGFEKPVNGSSYSGDHLQPKTLLLSTKFNLPVNNF